MSKYSLSIYLPTFNQPMRLKSFLSNIYDVYSRYFNLKVIVIDASTDFLSSPPYSLPSSFHVFYIRVPSSTMWGDSINISIRHFKQFPSDFYVIANIDVFHPSSNAALLSDLINNESPEYILPKVHLLDKLYPVATLLDKSFIESLYVNNCTSFDMGSYYNRQKAAFLINSNNVPRNICETVFLLLRSDLVSVLPDFLIPSACPHYLSDYYFTGYISSFSKLQYVFNESLYVIRMQNIAPSKVLSTLTRSASKLSPNYFPAYFATVNLLGINFCSPKILAKLALKFINYIFSLICLFFRF